MYVDDSGSPSMKDNSDFYVISGVIIHETKIYPVEGTTQSFKSKFEEFNHAEIHVHDIFKGQKEFSGLTLPRKYQILGHLYNMIDADACAYCTLKHQNAYVKFDRYWEIVRGKMRKGPNGNVLGFGFKIFPH